MHAGRPPQQVAATVHVANKTRPGFIIFIVYPCMMSLTGSAVSANVGLFFHFGRNGTLVTMQNRSALILAQ